MYHSINCYKVDYTVELFGSTIGSATRLIEANNVLHAIRKTEKIVYSNYAVINVRKKIFSENVTYILKNIKNGKKRRYEISGFFSNKEALKNHIMQSLMVNVDRVRKVGNRRIDNKFKPVENQKTPIKKRFFNIFKKK